jgi:hypothetical protein
MSAGSAQAGARDASQPDFEGDWRRIQAKVAAQSPLGHQVIAQAAATTSRTIGPNWCSARSGSFCCSFDHERDKVLAR